ncbi:ribonuclease P protein component [Cutibacterium granulosum DSM 20700]|uniref:Ribonuclease P protein component n=1 Tax=Cutibacterium granulosum DSM 20700 TaxID=1160719 RepID=U1GH17_9ACTN|nr:ribonuclease P protein component [Cutibacterium granulosum DSM 20700]
MSTLADATTCSDPGAAPRVGFVVSKAVGNAVTRHRVARQLRHLARPLAEQLPLGCLIVVRALPAAARHPQQLPSDLSSAWTKALDKLQRHTAAQSSTDSACDNCPQTNGRTPDDTGAHIDTADAGAKGPAAADELPTMSPVRREV